MGGLLKKIDSSGVSKDGELGAVDGVLGGRLIGFRSAARRGADPCIASVCEDVAS